MNLKIDITISLINFAIALGWDGESKNPCWMRKSDFVPCDCGMCYFCLNGSTDGIGQK